MNNPEDNLGNLVFTSRKIKFFPEDEEKMKTMDFEERMDYLDKLRDENRFTIIDDNEQE